MGQFLSQPATEKKSENGGDDFVKFGLSSMQGWRISMEDSHFMVLDLNKIQSYKKILAQGRSGGNSEEADKRSVDTENDEETAKQQGNNKDEKLTNSEQKATNNDDTVFDEQIAFFGVFDGHGGANVALFSGEHFPEIVKDHADTIKNKDYGKALQDSFLACDRAILDDPAMKNDSSGCAATTIMVTKQKLICANAGDSRIVLSIDGHAKPMSYDHKPSNEGEKARIVAAGGFVDVGRVNGNLALSRCIGDFDFKKSPHLPAEEQVVTAYPDIIEHDVDYDHDEFIILACDGIWDCLTSQQCVELVRKGINERLSLTEISEAIIDVCVAPNSMGTGIGCDNMSIAIVALLNDKSLEQWYDDIIAKGGPISKPFNEVRFDIYETEEGPGDYEKSGSAEGNQDGDEADGSNASGFGKSLSQLISSSAATFQDGTYYIDTSRSSSVLASLGFLGDDDISGEKSGRSRPFDDRSSSDSEQNDEGEESDDNDDKITKVGQIEEIEDTDMKREERHNEELKGREQSSEKTSEKN